MRPCYPTLGGSGKNLEDFDHGGKKAAYCRYKLINGHLCNRGFRKKFRRF